MCGIAGFVTVQPSDSPSILERMTDTIRHRGPDDSGYYRDPYASLFIVFNGEIFNHAALRPSLEQAGHRYTTRSDTETILHSFEQYGPDCVLRLRVPPTHPSKAFSALPLRLCVERHPRHNRMLK